MTVRALTKAEQILSNVFEAHRRFQTFPCEATYRSLERAMREYLLAANNGEAKW